MVWLGLLWWVKVFRFFIMVLERVSLLGLLLWLNIICDYSDGLKLLNMKVRLKVCVVLKIWLKGVGLCV